MGIEYYLKGKGFISMSLEHIKLFYPGLNGCANYRIPSIITTDKGTLIAAIDARVDRAGDNPNNIDKYIIRSTDGGDTWGPIQNIVDYPGRSDEGSAACDPAMLQDEETKTIWMIFNHTPAGIGLWASKPGIGFDKDGYRILYDESGNEYILKEDTFVYHKNGEKTSIMIDENGDVLKDGQKIGNIYLKNGPMLETRTSFLQAVKSEDDGLTWSEPIDLNPHVKEEWMGFIGAGPGRGIQLKNGAYKGRLVFPIYFNNALGGRMSCTVIYSDDHGNTWKRGRSPNDGRIWNNKVLNSRTLDVTEAELTECQIIEMGNGDLKMFMRNHAKYHRTAIAISKDGGESWKDISFHDELVDPICQSTVIKHRTDDGKSYLIWANPAHPEKRIKGTVRLSEDEGKTWPYSRVIREAGYGYSCLTVLPDGRIGLLYEPDDEPGVILFTRFSLNWIMGKAR